MRKLPAIFQRLLVLAACLFLSACFDIREEVWIEHNGAGRAELRYTVPDSALLFYGGTSGVEKKIRDLVATQPALTLDDVSVTVKDARATVSVKVSTKSMFSLLDLKKSESFQNLPETTANIAGHFDVRLRWLDLDFSRSVHVKEALGFASLAVSSQERESHRLTYIIHLPKPAKEHNATQVTDGGRTLTWDYTLGESMRKPIVTSFRATMPIPRYLLAAIVGLLLGIVAAFVWWRKRRTTRRRASGS